MTPARTQLLQLSLNILYRTGLCKLLQARTSGVGAIFMLHHVVDKWSSEEFSPNRGLEVSSAFLETVITEVIDHGYEIVDLDEARRRLLDGDRERRIACFTIDDGYADNYLHAMPVFERFGVPFTLYLNSGLPDGTMLVWWRLLERVIAQQETICANINGEEQRLDVRSPRSKYRAFMMILRNWRRIAPHELRNQCLALCARYNIDDKAVCRELALSWAQLREMLATGIVTIGAHTVSHTALAAMSPDDVADELRRDSNAIERELGQRPRHFAYPFGDATAATARDFVLLRELGFSTATTTRKGLLHPDHAAHLHALPRVSLNGDFQNVRYIRALMSGVPFMFKRGMRRLDID